MRRTGDPGAGLKDARPPARRILGRRHAGQAAAGLARPVYEARTDSGDRLLFTVARSSLAEHPDRFASHLQIWDLVEHDDVDRAARRNAAPEAEFLELPALEQFDIDEPPLHPDAALEELFLDDAGDGEPLLHFQAEAAHSWRRAALLWSDLGDAERATAARRRWIGGIRNPVRQARARLAADDPDQALHTLAETGASPETARGMVAAWQAERAGRWEEAASLWRALGRDAEEARCLARATRKAGEDQAPALAP